jgi:diguanylate cyclase (GGDEF)-like protein/PAS domain S-box-containing protein
MFKTWSIKRLLQFCAVVTATVVVFMALMANYANGLINSTRFIMADQVLPLEQSSRRLSTVATAFSSRQKQILNSQLLPELDQLQARGMLEQSFMQNWLRLSQIFASGGETTQSLNALFNDYQDFLRLDTELFQLKQQSLLLTSQLQQHSEDVDIQAGQLLQQLASLEERLRSARQIQLQNILEPIQLAIFDLSMLTHRVMLTRNDAQLQTFKQQLASLQKSLTEQLASLKKAFNSLPELRDRLVKLNYDIEVLFRLLTQEQGLFHLHEDRLLNQTLLTQTEQSSLTLMTLLIEKVNMIAQDSYAQSYDTISHNVDEADHTRWLIISLSALVSLGMMIFVLLVFRAISHPLGIIRRSIKALSEGRFDTRIFQSGSQNELSLLAKDFNQFAENTEQMIDALSNARSTLQNREEHIRAVLNGVPEAILTLSEKGTIIDTNPAAEQVLGGKVDSLCGMSLFEFFKPELAIDSTEALLQYLEKNGDCDGQRLDGTPVSMWLSLSLIDSVAGKVWVCVISDVTAWKQTDERLQQLSHEQDAILENAIIGIAFIRDRKFVRVNQRFEQIFGFERDQIVGQSTISVYPNEQAYQQFGEQSYPVLAQGSSYEAQLELVKHNGEKFWAAVSGKSVDPLQPLAGTIWLFEDVTKQRENEEYLTRLANIDALTGLPNRNVFNDRVAHAIHKAQRDAGRLAVFFLDLDHFKHINDSMGHKAGDILLTEVANRIKSCLREGDTVARLGGDEFTLLLEDVRSAEYVGKVAEKVIQAMSRPFAIESTEVTVSPSIGISLYPADGRDGDMLVRNADAAMYHAKKLGRNNFQFYSLEMNAEAAERLSMETALRRAVEHNEFYLHYQPQFDFKHGGLSGAEVLLRWHSKEWGEVAPSRFVPVLEDLGLIVNVGEWVLRQACESYLSMREQLGPDFVIAVNMSGRQFKGGMLASSLRRLLNEIGMPAKNLELEITETMLMEDTELATFTLSELSEMGISLAIDDFGTGYSSLSYLKQFPLNVLKIDSSFIRDITHDEEDAAIVDAILAMSASLRLTVVAEGVETEEQLAYLKQRNCHRAQGYYLGRPVDKDTFAELVQQQLRA